MYLADLLVKYPIFPDSYYILVLPPTRPGQPVRGANPRGRVLSIDNALKECASYEIQVLQTIF